MALDAESAAPIELVINSPGGPVDAGLSVIDTLDLLRAPVAALCLGQAGGTAAAVLACVRSTRRATPTADRGPATATAGPAQAVDKPPTPPCPERPPGPLPWHGDTR